jgi:hypothetical protein
MPGEFRRLTFQYSELNEALESCGNELANKLLGGSMTAIESRVIDGTFHYDIEIFDASKGKKRHAIIPESEIHDALIDFCMQHHIPLPRDSIKTIRLVGGQICLDVLVGEAEGVNRTMEHFLANLSHQLRTPLNAIIGFSTMMTGGVFGPMESRYREYAENIHASGEHLLGVLSNAAERPTEVKDSSGALD